MAVNDDRRRSRLQQRSKWERLAAGMPDFSAAPSTRYYRACEIALLRRALGDLAGKRILKLDLWNEAINTRILNWMEAQGARAFGFDLSLAVTARARVNGGSRLHLACADIREFPFAGDSFDALYTMGTIEHIAEYRQALAEVQRVLRPGGTAVVGVPRKWDAFLRPLLVRGLDLLGRYPYSPEKSFSAAELRRDLEGAGLRVVEQTGILALPGVLRMADLFLYTRRIPLYRLTPLLTRPLAAAEGRWRWPGRLGYLLTLVARKPA